MPPHFRAVFDQEFGYVWNTLRRLGVRNADLEDVTHEVFLVFHRRMADYDPARPLRPWLFGIAHRVSSDHRKLARHRHEVPSTEEHVARATSGPEEELERRQGRELLVRALAELDPDRRAVLVMHDLDEVGMPEVAETLGIPLNTGYSRLRLARKELAEAVRRLAGGARE